jgi:hypothetical protein
MSEIVQGPLSASGPVYTSGLITLPYTSRYQGVRDGQRVILHVVDSHGSVVKHDVARWRLAEGWPAALGTGSLQNLSPSRVGVP